MDLYGNNSDASTSLDLFETISRTSRVCWNLHKWKESLPAALQPPMPGEVLTWVTGPDLHITRLRHFLSLRYYYQQITAYRAVLTKFLDDFTTSDNLGEQYVPLRRTGVGLLQDCVRCCAVLINLVELVLQASEEQVTLNGAWWLCSYYGQ
jgi:hypothetical protein